MNETTIIELLTKQIETLQAENKDLREIIRTFASKETNVIVNSYNGSYADAEAKGATIDNANNDNKAHNITTGKGAVIDNE